MKNVMECFPKLSVAVLTISIIIGFYVYIITLPPQVAEISLQYWGPGKEKPDFKAIIPFKISFPEYDLQELKEKLVISRFLQDSLGDGIDALYIKSFVEFWKTKYNWTERETYLNQYPQFKTQVAGLDMHFIHVKPNAAEAKGKQILPLLMIHGWPSSVREFYNILPMLTSPRPDADFVFEVIAPSLPGFGFSQASSKPGLHAAHIASILDELMTRLGHDKYYIQGGDWGSLIGQAQAVLFPDRVLGFHSNFCISMTLRARYHLLLFQLFPKYFVEESKQEQFADQLYKLLSETGYFHLQATKPDTIGWALTDSPVGLATYILEKFSIWTNAKWKSFLNDKLENLNKVELLDNIMIYWLTRSISTSMRLYKETFGSLEFFNLGILQNQVPVPSACALFENEMIFTPQLILKEGFRNLVSLNYIPKGGHFAAFEAPKLLSEDIWSFMKNLRTRKKRRKR